MAALEALSVLVGINPNKLTKTEQLVLEIELFIELYDQINHFFQTQYTSYFSLIKMHDEKENNMLNLNSIRLVINDILSTGDYDLSGIAYYTDTPEDIVYEISSGVNTRPGAFFMQRIFELHRLVRRDLYDHFIKNILNKHLK